MAGGEGGTVIYFTEVRVGEGEGHLLPPQPLKKLEPLREVQVRWVGGRRGGGGELAHTCIAEEGNTCAPRGGGGGGGRGCARLIRG